MATKIHLRTTRATTQSGRRKSRLVAATPAAAAVGDAEGSESAFWRKKHGWDLKRQRTGTGYTENSIFQMYRLCYESLIMCVCFLKIK